jgi:hypothetical protein
VTTNISRSQEEAVDRQREDLAGRHFLAHREGGQNRDADPAPHGPLNRLVTAQFKDHPQVDKRPTGPRQSRLERVP